MSTSNLPESTTDSASAVAQDGDSTLVSDRGKTIIAEGVVARVADLAAREVSGVHSLTGGVGGRLRRFAPGMSESNRAAAVEVGERETIIALEVIAEYGVSIPQLAEAVRSNVIERVEYTTGLNVKEVNIDITDLWFPDADSGEEEHPQAS